MSEYVAIEQCYICGGDIGILLNKKMDKVFDNMKVSYPSSVCNKCREKYLTNGVVLLENGTGRFIVIKDEAFNRIFSEKIPKSKIAVLNPDIFCILVKNSKKEVK